MSTLQKYHKLFNFRSLSGLVALIGLFLLLRAQFNERNRTFKVAAPTPESYIVFSQSGKEFFAGDATGWIKWDIETHQKLKFVNLPNRSYMPQHNYQRPETIYFIHNNMNLSWNGKQILTTNVEGGTQHIKAPWLHKGSTEIGAIWLRKSNVETGKVEVERKITSAKLDYNRVHEQTYVLAASFSADGRFLATFRNHRIPRRGGGEQDEPAQMSVFDLWNVKTLKKIKSIPMRLSPYHDVYDFQLSPKGNYFAFVTDSSYDSNNQGGGHYSLVVWSIQQSKVHRVCQTGKRACFSFSPNENDVVTSWGVDHLLIHSLRNPNIQAEVVNLRWKSGDTPISLRYSWDSKTIAVGSQEGQVAVINREQNGQTYSQEHHNGVIDLAFSPDSKNLASISGSTVKLWHLK